MAKNKNSYCLCNLLPKYGVRVVIISTGNDKRRYR